MGLTDLFRPKYRHSDAAVRADAVRQMGADEADLVARIARDDRDASVRRIAIDRIEDPGILADIAAKEPEPGLRDHARARAAGLWAARVLAADRPDAAETALAGLAHIGEQRALADVAARAADADVRAAALGKLTEARALADLARNASAYPGTRRAALERINDLETLRAIAVDEQNKDVALAALERIEDAGTLEQVATKAKNKAVRTRARKRLSERAAPAAEQAAPTAQAAPASGVSPEDKRRHAERVQLLHRIEKLVHTSEWVQSAEEMAEIERQWAEVGAPGQGEQTDQGERFARARARYHARRDAHLRALADKEKQARRPAPETRAARREPATAAPAAVAAPEPAEQRPSAPPAEGESQAPVAQAEAAASAEAAAPAESSVAAAAAEPVENEQARLARQEAERAREERRAQALASLEQLVHELERLSEATRRKQVERALQRTEQAFKGLELPPGDQTKALIDRYHAARNAAFIKAQELREAEDWERWANVPRQEALIAKAEAMFTEEDDGKLGERLKALQNEWRAIGPVPQKKSRELWERFKTACDKIYERVKVARSRVNDEMQANLARKEALCERVEALAESEDWDATAEEIKKLQNEWRQIGPVPRKRSDAVWKRFRAACDRFFERRKPHLEEMLAERTQNLEKKTALCQQAEALAESTEWKETALQLRDLQREWRDIGPVPRKDAQAINKRFRAACDRFFERREQHLALEREARARAVETLRADLQALIEGKPAEAQVAAGEAAGEAAGTDADGQATPGEAASPVERIARARHALRDMSLSPAEQAELYGLVNQAALVMLAEAPEIFRGTELDPVLSRQRKQKLCARAEEIAPAPQTTRPVPDAQTPEAMAERLRAALAQNALSSSLAVSTDGRNIVESIVELEASWWRLGPVPGPEGADLEARFRAACERARQSVGKQVEHA
jgi:hypothetical protein